MPPLVYKDGKTEPKVGDVVLGDKLKGRVAGVDAKAGKVLVASRPKWDASMPRQAILRGPLKDPLRREVPVQTPVDPALLELVHRRG